MSGQFAVLAALRANQETAHLTHGEIATISYLGSCSRAGATKRDIIKATPISQATIDRALAAFIASGLVWSEADHTTLRPGEPGRPQVRYGLTKKGSALNRKITSLFRNPPKRRRNADATAPS